MNKKQIEKSLTKYNIDYNLVVEHTSNSIEVLLNSSILDYNQLKLFAESVNKNIYVNFYDKSLIVKEI